MGTIKETNFQISGTKVKIAIELDLAEAIKGLRYDVNQYDIPQWQLDYGYLAEVIVHELDWQAFMLSTNDDHTLARILADLNDN
jgi:hypothetical protein